MLSSSAALLERIAHAHHLGQPAARQRLIRLFEYLVWELTLPRRKDPTPSEIEQFQSPRLGPAYLAFLQAIEEIGDPDFIPQKTYQVFIRNKIRKANEKESDFERYAFGPSQSERRRARIAGRKLCELDRSADGSAVAAPTSNPMYAELRDRLDALPLNDEERQVVALTSDGWKDIEIAAQLGISAPRVSTIKKNLKKLADDFQKTFEAKSVGALS